MAGPFDDIPRARVPEPKDSALGVLLRRGASGAWEVLFGRRSRRSRFMPGHLAFPGGRMDEADEPGRPGAFARCAAREVEEEAGLAVDPAGWFDIGERITPPMFPVRFRTRFFVGELPDGASLSGPPPRPEEIEELRVADARAVLDEWSAGTSLVPPPCLPLLRCIATNPALELDALAAALREVNTSEQRLPRIEFVPDVWVLPVRSRTIPPAAHTNVWMPGVGRFAIFDPGSDEPEEIERLLGVVEKRRATGATPAAVVLTHAHPDHVAGAGAVAGALSLPVLAHRSVLERVELPPGLPPPRVLQDGDTIDLDGLTMRALHTPGHAPGHLAFEVPERNALIAGDLVSGLSTILILPPPEGDMQQYLDSLARVRDGKYRVLLPAHGPPVPPRMANKLIDHRMHRESLVRAELTAASRSLAEIARGAYSDAPPEMPDSLTEGQTLAHLLYLEKRGLARREGDDTAGWVGSD